MIGKYFTVALLLLASVVPAAARPQAPPPGTTADFTIFIQGAPVGSERVTVTTGADGWTISATGRIGAPLNLVTSRFEVRYDTAWHPLALTIEGSLRGQPLVMHTTFAGTTATSEITQAGQLSHETDQVAPDTIVLPNLFFAAYEAMALRLASLQPGASFKAYVVPQAELEVRVTSVDTETIQTAGKKLETKRYGLSLANPGGPVAMEFWTDPESRMVRIRIPSQRLDVARVDAAAVNARVERLSRPGDEQAHVPANGFSLAATVSRPSAAPAAGTRWPAVVLVPGSGPMDRDETVAGIPIFAQVANALADQGYLVLRYDKRGVGQSGGRDEAATLADFAEDVRAIVTFLGKRKDVDPKHIVLVGHSEGGLVAMLAASREKKVAAVGLLATPGTTGAELVLEQQQHMLGTMDLAVADRQARIDMQKKIVNAVLSGTGWEGVPPAFRRQTDTPWYKSFLMFDPARVLPKVSQPVLILQGELDRQVAARHAGRLADIARARKKNPGTEVFVIAGVNHLLVPARTGEVAEYASLPDKHVSKDVLDPLIKWLAGVTAPAASAASRPR